MVGSDELGLSMLRRLCAESSWLNAKDKKNLNRIVDVLEREFGTRREIGFGAGAPRKRNAETAKNR
jgi:hypothetical protein